MTAKERKTGVLLHITSLPSPFGVGDLGDSAYQFVDTLSVNGIKLWQILPIGPTGFGDSPYAARSAFAGNELFISPKKLFEAGFLELSDMLKVLPESSRVDYGKARELKEPLLEKAAKKLLSSRGKEKKAYLAYREKEGWWLEDYCLFQALCRKFQDSRWFSMWPAALRDRKKDALEEARKELKSTIDLFAAEQYFFAKQFIDLKTYANSKKVEIVGDIPIFVAYDSSDAWCERKLLKLDRKGGQEVSSGVPPDAFSSTGQLWGNPIYRWEEHEKTGFAWWIRRIKKNLEYCNVLRIDHFRGFEACWEVPAGDKTAENGKWVAGPRQAFFDALKAEFGSSLPIIAEDLGVITPEVEALRDGNGFPGMKILQFAFGFEKGKWQTNNPYLPHNFVPNAAAYTGTHDNNTTRGWYNSLDEGMKDYIRRYFECSDQEVVWKMIRALIASPALYAIVPMQDLLGLGEEARMNVPSTCGTSNWSWRMLEKNLQAPEFSSVKYLSELFGRA